MKPYPAISACVGACQQGKHPCTTEALCNTSLHRVTPAEVTDREYNEIKTEDDLTPYAWPTVVTAICIVALIGLAVSMDSIMGIIAQSWPRLVAMLAFGGA